MTPTKPYLVRAFNEWILDNELTPYLIIDATRSDVYVPSEYIQDGKIIFNITPGIVSMLSITNEVVEFEARFSGRKRRIYAPMAAVLAIYAKENGQGMMFDPESELDDSGSQQPLDIVESNEQGDEDNGGNDGGDDTPPPKRGKPNLKVVK